MRVEMVDCWFIAARELSPISNTRGKGVKSGKDGSGKEQCWAMAALALSPSSNGWDGGVKSVGDGGE